MRNLIVAAVVALAVVSNLGTPAALAEQPPPEVSSASIPAGAISITAHGARCDGHSDDSAAIAAAITAARAQGVAVAVPAGICAYGDLIRLDGVKLLGAGPQSVLHALDWSRQSIFVSGDGVEIRNLTLAGVRAPSRQANWEATRITLFGATNFVIDHITIEGSAAAGIQTADGASRGRITNNRITDTLSDAIHLTDRASHLTVEGNRIEGAGDDGIAVVSYQSDGGLVHHITARNNVVLNNRWGRQMSVVGGRDILYENNYLEANLAAFACLYIAQERPYATYGAKRVVVRYNTLTSCGGADTGHGAVMVYSDGWEPNTNITLTRNDIRQDGQPGIRIFGPNNSVAVRANRIIGAVPATDIATPGVILTPYVSGRVGATTTP